MILVRPTTIPVHRKPARTPGTDDQPPRRAAPRRSSPGVTGGRSASRPCVGSTVVGVHGFDSRLDLGGAHHIAPPPGAGRGHESRRDRGCRHGNSAFMWVWGGRGRVSLVITHICDLIHRRKRYITSFLASSAPAIPSALRSSRYPCGYGFRHRRPRGSGGSPGRASAGPGHRPRRRRVVDGSVSADATTGHGPSPGPLYSGVGSG